MKFNLIRMAKSSVTTSKFFRRDLTTTSTLLLLTTKFVHFAEEPAIVKI